MLVLTRKKNESIRIADDIRVTVVEVRGNKVRLGIDAPPDVSIARGELWISAEDASKFELQTA